MRNFDFARDIPYYLDPDQFIYENVIVVDIEYYSSEYTEINEEPKMNWEDLFAELGGHLHIFIGMSLLSFVEVVELFGFMATDHFWNPLKCCGLAFCHHRHRSSPLTPSSSTPLAHTYTRSHRRAFCSSSLSSRRFPHYCFCYYFFLLFLFFYFFFFFFPSK